MKISIKKAKRKDMAAIRSLLESSGLPADDIAEFLKDFLVVWKDGDIIGTAGFERYDHEALLRSFVIEAAHRGQKIGQKLFDAAMIYARNKNIKDVYLLTETAEPFFSKNDFTPIVRQNAPASILNTREFQEFCSSNAVVMFKNIDQYKYIEQ